MHSHSHTHTAIHTHTHTNTHRLFSNGRLYTRFRYFTELVFSTSAKVLEWYRYAGFHFKQVPHTYSVSQPLPWNVYAWRNRYPEITRLYGDITRPEDSLVLCFQLPPQCFNHWAMPDSGPHRYPTHILSHNHYHHIRIREGIGTRKSLEFTVI